VEKDVNRLNFALGDRFSTDQRTIENHQLFAPELFRGFIAKERNRTDRSGLAMAILLIGLHEGQGTPERVRFSDVAHALSTIKTDTDIMGWFDQDSVMGLLVPDIDEHALAATCERLEADFRREIAHHNEGDPQEGLTIRLRVYPEPRSHGEEGSQQVDPFLYPELHADQKAIRNFHVLKRGIDIFASILLLLSLLPLLLAIAGLVKLTSRGPVIFRQVRIGQMMKPFRICKFRTMYADADNGIHHDYVSWFINSSAKVQAKGTASFFKLTNDPRITPIGHVLRKTSLDELPQLWNVLRGEMSLVGPRPPLWYELQQYKPWHRHRVLEAKPGITGLWQVTGRSRTTFDDMVRLDLRYARARSLWADIRILLATPAAVIKGKGAC
jgi:lipopolysaccharide/colanic/teichoic acid biosynthesis glycosyltransferase